MVGYGTRWEVAGDGMWDTMGNSWRREMSRNWRERMVGDDRRWEVMGDGGRWHMVGNSRQCRPCWAGTQDPWACTGGRKPHSSEGLQWSP